MPSPSPPSGRAAPIVVANAASIGRAADALRAGRLVAFPTETVYGLGASALDEDAVRAIFTAKRRPANHPLIVHIASVHDTLFWTHDLPRSAQLLADAFWPGPLTLIVPRRPGVGAVAAGGESTIGLRVPAHPVARALLAAFAGAIAAPSANRFGRVSTTAAAHVAAEFGDEVACVLDGGDCEVGIESTIVDCSRGRPVILRPGIIAAAAIAAVAGTLGAPQARGAPRASGTLASHYAPDTAAFLVAPEAFADRLAASAAAHRRVGVLARTLAAPADAAQPWLQAPLDAAGYAHVLYARLRELDQSGVDEILIEAPPGGTVWAAVRDRLQRATFRSAEPQHAHATTEAGAGISRRGRTPAR